MSTDPIRSLTILFSSAGRRHHLLRCFREDAVRLKIELRIVAVDVDPAMSAACRAADAHFEVPRCQAPGFVPALLEICRREGVALLIPTIDPELRVLSEHRDEFRRVGTRVLVGGEDLVALANSKFETARRLAAAGISTPATAWLRQLGPNPDLLRWPVIAKPDGGSSSQGVVVLRTPGELAGVPDDGRMIAQEFWRGTEYTLNVFFDGSGGLRCLVPHERIEVRAGEVSKGRTRRVPALARAVEEFARLLPGTTGPLCLQAIVTASGDYAIFEFNARFGGGYPLAHRAGARFPQWLMEECCGLPRTAGDQWRENVIMLRYDDALFIDA